MKVNFKFEDKDIKVNFENNYRLKEQTTEKGIKVLMLKGEKGDPGIGGAEWGGITGTLSNQEDLNNELTTMAGNISTNASDILSLNTRVGADESSISDIDGRVTTNTSNISTLDGKVTTNTSNISSLGSRVTTVETDMGNYDTRITTNTNNITELDGSVTTNTNNIAGLVVNTLTGDETTKAPSVRAVKEALKVVNTYSKSTSDTYSANYLNDKLVNVGTSVDENYRVNILHSKNLFNIGEDTATNNEVTVTYEGSKLSFNGTTIGSDNVLKNNYSYVSLGYFEAGTYTFSFAKESGTLTLNSASDAFYLRKTGSTIFSCSLNSTSYSYTFTLDTATQLMGQYYVNSSGAVYDNYVIDFQIEKGSTATTYEPYITPAINVDGDEIYSKDNIEKYSTSETQIGTWIDGKPLYRKVINFGAMPNNTTSYKAHGISNIGLCFIKGTTNDYYQIPFRNISNNNSITTWHNSKNVFIQTNFDGSEVNATLVMEYTKTTD